MVNYIKTLWENRVVQRPRTYQESENSDHSITHTPAPGTVVQAGTPRSAENMNHIEEGIANCAAEINRGLTILEQVQSAIADDHTRIGNNERSIAAIQALDETQSTNIAALTRGHNALAVDVENLENDARSHIENRSNPHRVSYAQIGAAAANHTHTISQIVGSGVIPLSMGGTSVASLDALKTLLGVNFVIGTYMGDGTVEHHIVCGFHPKRVFIFPLMMGKNQTAPFEGIGCIEPGKNIQHITCSDDVYSWPADRLIQHGHGGAAVEDNGFVVSTYVGHESQTLQVNKTEMPYGYIAFKEV